MQYYSTNKQTPPASLEEAVVKGLAPDKGLYMPEKIKRLPPAFFHNMGEMSLREISFIVAEAFFGEDAEIHSNENLYQQLYQYIVRFATRTKINSSHTSSYTDF